MARVIIFSVLCMLLANLAATQRAVDVHAQFTRLLAQIKASQRSGHLQLALSRSLDLADLLHHSAPSTEQVAMAYAELGERPQALQSLRQFAAMGQSDDALAGRPQFKSVKSSPEFKRILARMRQNESRIDQAPTVIGFGDAGLVPEDMDYDTATRSFLVTSVLEKKIVRVGLNGRVEDFAKSPDGWPMLAIRIDARRGIVWATEVALDHFADVPSIDWGRSALLCLRLADGTLMRRIDAPHTALGDMALMPDGDVIVSDGDNGGIYRARAGCADPNLQRIDSGQFISPQTPAPMQDGVHVFIPDYVRGLALLDVKNGKTRWVKPGHDHALQGIDGMYLVHGELLAVQNGASPERVVAFTLNDALQVTGETVIDRSTPAPGDYTHGVPVGGIFYYIANSGWSSLDSEGRVKPGTVLTPATVREVPVADVLRGPD